MSTGVLYVGTSGWHYKHWKEVFYPITILSKDYLKYYAHHFKTVEINNTFYKLPDISTLKNWRTQVPAPFIFSVKASRFFTHIKKLNVDKEGLQIFFKRISQLKGKLGPILFQLPPSWKKNIDKLSAFLKNLPRKYHKSFEFRNATWYDEEVYALLKKYNCAFCIYQLAGHLSPLITTADFVYIRLHGPKNKYQGKYAASTLALWKKRCTEWQKMGMDVYIYFDNDEQGYAIQNAQAMAHHSQI